MWCKHVKSMTVHNIFLIQSPLVTTSQQSSFFHYFLSLLFSFIIAVIHHWTATTPRTKYFLDCPLIDHLGHGHGNSGSVPWCLAPSCWQNIQWDVLSCGLQDSVSVDRACLIGLGSGEFTSWVKALGLCCIPEHLCDWAGALSHLMRPVLRLQWYHHGRYAWSTATLTWHPHQCQDPRFSSISCNKSITFIKFTCHWCCN